MQRRRQVHPHPREVLPIENEQHHSYDKYRGACDEEDEGGEAKSRGGVSERESIITSLLYIHMALFLLSCFST